MRILDRDLADMLDEGKKKTAGVQNVSKQNNKACRVNQHSLTETLIYMERSGWN